MHYLRWAELSEDTMSGMGISVIHRATTIYFVLSK
jgi:hypothetical protein